MATLQKRINSGRKRLSFKLRDLNIIRELGERTQNVESDSFLNDINNFKARVIQVSPLVQEYLNTFDELSDLAGSGDDTEIDLFPSDLDFCYREEVNDVYGEITKYQQQLSKVDKAIEKYKTNSCDNSLARTRLPKISLPHFSGNIEHWIKFKSLFQSMIHLNPEIPLIEKFHYLHTSLSGEPLSLISALTLNDRNYDEAWNAICRRYDNKRLLAASYIDKFIDFAPLKGNPNLQALQSFISNIGETVAGFQSIEIDNEADFIWLSLALKKLDPKTREQFEAQYVGQQFPTFGNLVEFIHERSKVLQLSCNQAPNSSFGPNLNSSNSKPFKQQTHSKVLTTLTPQPNRPSSPGQKVCPCKQNHALYACPVFRNSSALEKGQFLKGKPICYNCLTPGHMSRDCSSKHACKKCNFRHNTLIHDSMKSPHTHYRSKSPPTSCTKPVNSPAEPASTAVIASVTGSNAVILGTAKALMQDSQGNFQSVRLLLDGASQCSLITTECVRRLGLSWTPSHIKPIGAGEVVLPKVRGKSKCQLFSLLQPGKSYVLDPLVVNTITGFLPSAPLPCSNRLNYGSLADQDFWKPGPIDLLIGGDLFMRVVTGSPCSVDKHYDALPTVFGLVIMGVSHTQTTSEGSIRCHVITEAPNTDHLLARFWETEEVEPPTDDYANDPCEQHFRNTHSRDSSGRYVLALPFKEPPTGLEGSKQKALMQYKNLEKKMLRNTDFQAKYNDFLQEYLTLGHMTETNDQSSYVIPHHGVFKANELNPKIRVVFNASCPTFNGSLNDKLYVGPKLQNDLTAVILSFRRYRIAVTADLVKMYRQILIRQEDRKYQHIFWRPDPTDKIKVYELNTVTYGQACAPFQAIRTIQQLVKDEGQNFPLASRALTHECYVDDVVSGGNSLAEAQQLQRELVALLTKGCFEIHKWASNCPDFLRSISNLVNSSLPLGLTPKDSNSTKILGMYWDPKSDYFYYQVDKISQPVTKRGILSVIARLFDPMGYLAPVIFKAKTILQELWKSQIEWDQTPPPVLCKEWEAFLQDLQVLNHIRIPRFILIAHPCCTQLIGFCDASQQGFAAALYLREISLSDETKISLLKAKTKLAPLKTLSIPRLELSAAHLLVKLYLSVRPFCEAIHVSDSLFFTDSTIVLAWLKISPYMLDTFVANRVSFIVSNTKESQWFHVASEENPADLSSRGCYPAQLGPSSLWWAGSSFLHDKGWVPPKPPSYEGEVPELRAQRVLLVQEQESELYQWMGKFSNYQRLIRILGYVLRAQNNFKYPQTRRSGELTKDETSSSLTFCLKLVQHHAFASDFSWTEKRPLSIRMKKLTVYLDEDGLLRVGGRLHNSDLPLDTQSPILLPGKCHFTWLLIRHLHLTHMHMGFQSLHALLRRTYWIFGLRQAIKGQLHRCLPCIKLRAKPSNPQMGDLPPCRVQPSRPFSQCGIDYAGPFFIKHTRSRNSSTSKAYLCLFVCMCTRAVHLELTSALSTDAFLATLDRFIARRGCPTNIISDNGTNFVGASNRLKDWCTLIKSKEHTDQLLRYGNSKGLTWTFNPPHAPHFGGLWEAGVKSAKQHLYRVTNSQVFWFEELTTIFARIEAVLNSRPLCPSFEDTSSGDVLTPGHFLIGSPLVALPEQNISDVKINYLSRWQLINHSVQHFWSRWHAEYLQSLQSRIKWFSSSNKTIKVDDLVLVPDPSSLPLQWRIGRITQCFPGRDNIVRVVSVKDHRGTFKHPIHKVVDLSLLNASDFSSL